MIAIALLAALAVAARQRLRLAGEQAAYLWHQHRCMTWRLPEDAVVYDDDPASAAELLKQSTTFRPPMHLAFDRGFPPAGWVPPATRYFPPFDAMESALVAGGFSVPLYMREATSNPYPGTSLIVVLVGTAPFGKDGYALMFTGNIYKPATWRPGSRATRQSSRGYGVSLKRADRLRLYAGQRVDANFARFVIPYPLNGTRGTITGKLLPPGAWRPSFDKNLNAPSIELTVTSGPLQWDYSISD